MVERGKETRSGSEGSTESSKVFRQQEAGSGLLASTGLPPISSHDAHSHKHSILNSTHIH